jgi:hypothetical protein
MADHARPGGLLPTLSLDSSIPITDTVSGEYTLRLDDDIGQNLASYCFEPAWVDDWSVGPFAFLLYEEADAFQITLLHQA